MNEIEELAKLLGADASFITDPDITLSYSRDQAPFAQAAPPRAVLLAKNAEHISTTLRFTLAALATAAAGR